MAATEPRCLNVDNCDSEESLSNEEWTIIDEIVKNKPLGKDKSGGYDENSGESDDTGDSEDSDDRSEGKEARAGIEILGTSSQEELNDESSGVFLEKQAEDSDGISVITESETEQFIVNKKFSEIEECRSQLCGALRKHEKPGEKTAPQVGTILNVVIACSLAAIIGLGAGRILSMDDKCPISETIDFGTIKMENDMLIGQLKELSEVKDVLDEIKANIPQVKKLKQKIVQEEGETSSKSSRRFEKPQRIKDTYSFDPDTTILEQLQTSLNTLSSVINGINRSDKPFKEEMSKTQNVIADLIKFKQIINMVVLELDDSDKPMEVAFLRKAERKIKDVCKSLLNDLTDTVYGLTMKIHHKLNIVRQKLNRRLCLLRNTESTDNKLFKSLEENNSFLESCDKILNGSFKSGDKSVENKKWGKANKRQASKTFAKVSEKRLEKSALKDEEKYLADSSSESSVPDLTYIHDEDFWKKRQVVRQDRQQAKPKNGKAELHAANLEKVKSMKSRGQSLRNLIMDALLPLENCQPSRTFWYQPVSVCPKPNPLKPLYSTVLKSVQTIAQPDQNSSQEGKPRGRWVIEDAQGFVVAEEDHKKETDFRVKVTVKVEDNSTETKHNVTPADSGVNFPTTKSMKEQWNESIRQPMVGRYAVPQYYGTPSGIPVQKHNQFPQQLKNVVKKPPATFSSTSQKPCKTAKKCSIVSATSSTSGAKKPASVASYNGSSKKRAKVVRSEKNMGDKASKLKIVDNKKMSRAKFGSKTTPLYKTTGSKMEKNLKKADGQRMNNLLSGEWQLQRSRARETQRERDRGSEWYFDRADSRKDARKGMDVTRSVRFCSPTKCRPFVEEEMSDKEFYDYWLEKKDMNSQKHSTNRAGFTAKKLIKMPHRKNVLQSRRR